jgi:uncharacterized membrane protein
MAGTGEYFKSMKVTSNHILSLALLLSLGLNVGLLSHRAGVKSGSIQGMRRDAMIEFMDIRNTLPPAEKEAFNQIMKTDRPALRQSRMDVKEQRGVVQDILTQPTIDPVKLDQALAELRNRNMKAMEASHKLAIDIMPHIPVEQRRQLMEDYLKMQ